MGYLDKNINMALVIIIVGIVVAMLAVTVFFQVGLKTRTTDFETTSENLTTCETQLANYQERLNTAQSQLSSTSEDIRRYDQLYETKVAELSDTSDELETANKRVQSLNLIKTGLETENSQLKGQTNQLQQSVNQLTTRVDDLEDDVTYWRSKFNCCEGSASIAECQSEC